MAAANPVQSLQEEATCSICLEYYKDPVITKCGHNFCRNCVLSACSEGEGTALSCPQCREPCSQGDLRANRQLQSMVELVKQLPMQQERPPGECLCAEHEEKLKLFCKKDKKLICVICRESKEHKAHTVYPIKEAAEEYKPKLQEWLLSLRGGLEATQQDKQEEEEDCKAMRNKVEAERKKIEEQFKRLQQLLNEQMKTVLGKLEEMDKKIAIVENANLAVSALMSSLEALIAEIAKKCEQPAGELLKDIGSTLHRYEQVMEQTPVRILKKYKVHVTLDEATAHAQVALSEERRRVTFSSMWYNRWAYSERFTHKTSVLGREGFTSGRHYWELQLMKDGDWTVGIVRESVNRKENITLCPESGAWTVHGCNGQYWALTSPQTPLSPHQCPLKLGLYLDYEHGRFSMYNADTMEALYTFTGAAFNDRLYPYFQIGSSADLRLV